MKITREEENLACEYCHYYGPGFHSYDDDGMDIDDICPKCNHADAAGGVIPDKPPVFYTDTPELRAFFEPTEAVKELVNNELDREPFVRTKDGAFWLSKWLYDHSPYQKGEALPSRECPEIDDEGYYCKSCQRGCVNGQQQFKAGPVTLVQVGKISLGVVIPFASMNPKSYLCQTNPVRSDQ